MPPKINFCRRCVSLAASSFRRILFLALIHFAIILPSIAQISPGPLSKGHSSLTGTTNCTSCHKVGGGERTFKCLECHAEIAARLNTGRGFHAGVVKKDSGSQTCATCHSEHNGEDFPLIKWQPSLQQFDHGKTGWSLEGKHAGLTCAKCHNPSHVRSAERTTIRVKDLNRTFLGLSHDCISCHIDQHQGRFGQNCQQCHSVSDWKSVPNFDHSKTRYPLTGSHTRLECAKCHTPGPDQKPRWTGLAFEGCNSCHRDPHRGAFQSACQTCHSTVSWKAVSMATLSTKFDHAATKFPLLGKHAGVECSKCHANGNFKQPIAFQSCSTCHRPDPHGGQFAQRADKGECSSCHTVDGFKPAKFTLDDHARTAYPLEGKHAALECAKCHIPAGKSTLFKIKFARCTDCHKDIHVDQFQSSPNLNRCENCHSVKGFQPSSFTLAKHKTTRYPLVGAHVAVACGDCHKPGLLPKYPETAAYRFESFACTTCHKDPHRGQFNDRMARAGAGGKPVGCQACHTMETWKDVTQFDHSTTKFALAGSHRAVACMDCHKPPNLEMKLMHVDFRAAPTKCEECHSDIHGGQFANAAKVTPCAGCHNSNKWKPSLFDHNARTAFKLEGVHANVRCARCHTLLKSVNGKEVLFYRPTPKECAACHGSEVKGF